MCFDIGIVVCGPNEALVVSGMFQVSERNKQTDIWVVFPRTGKMSKICPIFFFFGALL